MLSNPRELRGLAILAQDNQIKRIDASTYRVNSQAGNGSYLVVRQGLKRARNLIIHLPKSYQNDFFSAN